MTLVATNLETATVKFNAEYDNGNGGAAKTIDWNNGQQQKLNLDGASCTLTFTAPVGGVGHFQIKLSRSLASAVAVWPATVRWRNGNAPAQSTLTNQVDFVSFFWDGTNYFGSAILNFTP
jgi:hypothetical protein